ncbi:MAG: hypothetical protein LBC96_07185 [Lachnospiraceae bacterium]|jgi:hypothetical protein|nr:hypothetical protein [Lachnospiraceae bacterium]
MLKQLSLDLLKPLLILAAIIAATAILARVLMSGDTLAEYAAKNPDIAYDKAE